MVTHSLVAAVLLGILAGVIGPLVQARDMAFAVHGTAELSFAGAACALWLGASVTLGGVLGSVLGGLALAWVGLDNKNRNALMGVILPFGLGLGILFLSLYQGRSSNKFGLLAGQIVAVSPNELHIVGMITMLVLAVMAVFGRRLFFVAIDPTIAQVQGLSIKWLMLLFMLILSLVVAVSVQFVGALLLLSLLITPTSAAACVTARPLYLYVLSIVFAITAAVGGILLSLGPGLPIAPYVTTISFVIYVFCWLLGKILPHISYQNTNENITNTPLASVVAEDCSPNK